MDKIFKDKCYLIEQEIAFKIEFSNQIFAK